VHFTVDQFRCSREGKQQRSGERKSMPPLPELVLRLVAAALLGGLVGIDRELRERSAGLRTHALVSTGAALFMLVSAYGFIGVGQGEDPGRLAAQVVSGIGFLGAGTIIFRKDAVRGLTTAASVWTVAGIGLACGLGRFELAVAGAVVSLVILAGLRPLEELLGTKRRTVLRVKIAPAKVRISTLLEVVARAGALVERLQVHNADHNTHERVEIALNESSMPNGARMVEELRRLPGVVEVNCNLERAPASEAPEGDPVGRNGSDLPSVGDDPQPPSAD
jgi:putative Mg2+ transporter-C (MgtC) family protein